MKYATPVKADIRTLRLPTAMQRQPALRFVGALIAGDDEDPTPQILRVPFIIFAKRDGEIIDGVHRWLAAKAVGMTEVFVSYAEE
jgi:hypothetical protein